ncbi:dynein axonemal intermediate chain 4 [Periophthalmus magnuspinnatus]|uniref:dynein axonemal intermediate chain 4 n=1 Tax=Periophthalmus magnuspinnatus TaxID=409849 RepID=UPI00145A8FF3|nr:dynein axonemal intermediate chain 4 [Periophthalmus magnuspinnatus]
MSTAPGRDERRKKLVLRPSSRTVSVSQSRLTGSRLTGSRRSLGAGSKLLDKSAPSRQHVRVFDEEGNDVTPQPLHQGESGAGPPKSSRLFLDEISAGLSLEQMTSTGSSYSLPFSRSILSSSKFSSQSSIDSVNLETEEGFSRRDLLVQIPDVQTKKPPVKEETTGQSLDDLLNVDLTETDTVSLLDLPSIYVSTEAEDAQSITEKNKTYTEICKNRPGNEKYTERSAQTLHPQNKHKLTQSDSVTTTETGTFVSTWEMFDSLSGLEQEGAVGAETEPDHQGAEGLLTSSGAEHSASLGSSSGTESATSSMRDLEVCVSEAEVQSLLSGDTLLHSLMVMERSLVANTLQDKLAAYRLLPVLPDPDSPCAAPQTSPEASGPALVHLWSFSCDLTLGRRVNSLVWNKNNPDLLAVGYGASESGSSAGLICCWSLKNPTWPERVVPCDSPVTALDFSVKSPCQLAVGMEDGTVMICSVHSPQSNTSVLHSRACPHKHVAPVLQVKWTLQDVGLRDDKDEALVSAATDGRICKWFVSNNGLDCTDMMKLKRVKSAKKLSTEKTTDTKPENILSALTPGMCVHFHPKESGVYLVGTWEGLIHKCSSSNTQQYMDTYKKHFGPVLGVSYSPLCPGVFLSCSSDWTVQLWTEERLTPALSLSSGHRAVLAVQWSPKAAAVFGAVSETGLEIWDLQSSILDPLVALAAPPSLSLTSLLFTSHTDCALVGDSGGRVCVYLLRDVYGTEGPQVEVLEDIIHASISR